MNYNSIFQPVLTSEALREKKPMKVFFENRPLVIFRVENSVSAFEDFCPHRGAPLSQGFFVNNRLHCKYHGWSFDGETGTNTLVPVKNSNIPCSLKKFFVKEKFGLIWVSNVENARIPELWEAKPAIEMKGLIKATILNTLENFLEGSHTHYVHEGLIRSHKKSRAEITGRLVPNATGFKVFYEQEPAKGLVTKLLPKKYRNLKSVATYIHPNCAVLDFINDDNKTMARFEGVLNGENGETRYFARIFLNLGILTAFAGFFARFVFGRILEQDIKILEIQERNLAQFPGYKFVSDDTDIVGKQIYAWQYHPDKVLKEETCFKVFW